MEGGGGGRPAAGDAGGVSRDCASDREGERNAREVCGGGGDSETRTGAVEMAVEHEASGVRQEKRGEERKKKEEEEERKKKKKKRKEEEKNFFFSCSL